MSDDYAPRLADHTGEVSTPLDDGEWTALCDALDLDPATGNHKDTTVAPAPTGHAALAAMLAEAVPMLDTIDTYADPDPDLIAEIRRIIELVRTALS